MTEIRNSRTADFLAERRAEIVDVAFDELCRRRVRHYESTGPEETRLRLEGLYDALLHAAQDCDLGEILAYAERIATDRYQSGFGLSEVQAAFNVLEEAAWVCVFAELDSSAHAETLSAVSTILGAAKDALARRYVDLSAHAHAPALDLTALLTGMDRV